MMRKNCFCASYHQEYMNQFNYIPTIYDPSLIIMVRDPQYNTLWRNIVTKYWENRLVDAAVMSMGDWITPQLSNATWVVKHDLDSHKPNHNIQKYGSIVFDNHTDLIQFVLQWG